MMEKQLKSLDVNSETQIKKLVKPVLDQLDSKLKGIEDKCELFNAKQQAAIKKLLNKNKARVQLLKKKVAA